MTHSASIVFCLAALTAGMPLPRRLATAAAPKKVAVLYFDNYTGKADYDPLGRGIASMMISDLSAVKEMQLVERDRMQDLIKEIDSPRTKYFDSTTAVKVGRIVGAEYVVAGAITAAPPKIRIDTRVMRIETGEIVKTAQVVGDEDKFFDMQQKLSTRLVEILGIVLSPEEQNALASQQRANRVDNVATLSDFSHALQLYDAGDVIGSAKKMAFVIKSAPNSMFIRQASADIKQRATNAANGKVDEKKREANDEANRKAKEAADKAKDKIKSGIGGLIKRPPAL